MMQNKQGFTLLEVLVALVMLAIAFTASYLSLSYTARNLISLRDKTAAQWVGMNVIARAQTGILAIPQGGGTSNGTDQMFDRNWNWHLGINQSGSANVYLMTVDVSRPDTNAPLVHLTSYLYKSPV